MDENGRMKLNGISQLVKLKQALQHLHAIAARQKKKAEAAAAAAAADDQSKISSNNNNNNNNVNESETESQNENEDHQRLSAVINEKLVNYLCCDSDEESCQSPEHPSDVPRGFLAVYVGPENRRFIIPTSYLSHTVFKVLLEKAEEEFGFDQCGGLTLPCETETFKYLLKCMENQPMPLPETTSTGSSSTMEG